MVDDEDFDFLMKWKWQAHKSGSNYYARRDTRNGAIFMHREILNPGISMVIDHIDGNGLNNQRNNLRIATKSQNNMNKCKKKNCSSKFIGVCLLKNGLWKSGIQINRKYINIGIFKEEILAAKAYDKKAIELHGKFANLNFK